MNISIQYGTNKKNTSQIGGDQVVSFSYITNSKNGICDIINNCPQKIDKQNEQTVFDNNPNSIIAYFNFSDHQEPDSQVSIGNNTYKASNYGEGLCNIPYDFSKFVSIYKREVHYNYYNKKTYADPIWKPVIVGDMSSQTGKSIYRDYNVSNRRIYQYAYYFSNNINGKTDMKESIGYFAPIITSWDGWSITELTPTLDKKIFTSSPKDVWRFKYNISNGQQTQNIKKEQQETLSKYPRFSHGSGNSISGNVSCMLGRDMLPSNYVNSLNLNTDTFEMVSTNPSVEWDSSGNTINIGSYVEHLGRFDQKCKDRYISPNEVGFYDISSNGWVDTINEWRKVCYSGNPKLLKDSKGQKFLIQITSSSMQESSEMNRQPENISFDWVQIGDADDIMVIQISDSEFYKDTGTYGISLIPYGSITNKPKINNVEVDGSKTSYDYYLANIIQSNAGSTIQAMAHQTYAVDSSCSVNGLLLNDYDTFRIIITNYINIQNIEYIGGSSPIQGKNYDITVMKLQNSLLASAIEISNDQG